MNRKERRKQTKLINKEIKRAEKLGKKNVRYIDQGVLGGYLVCDPPAITDDLKLVDNEWCNEKGYKVTSNDLIKKFPGIYFITTYDVKKDNPKKPFTLRLGKGEGKEGVWQRVVNHQQSNEKDLYFIMLTPYICPNTFSNSNEKTIYKIEQYIHKYFKQEGFHLKDSWYQFPSLEKFISVLYTMPDIYIENNYIWEEDKTSSLQKLSASKWRLGNYYGLLNDFKYSSVMLLENATNYRNSNGLPVQGAVPLEIFKAGNVNNEGHRCLVYDAKRCIVYEDFIDTSKASTIVKGQNDYVDYRGEMIVKPQIAWRPRIEAGAKEVDEIIPYDSKDYYLLDKNWERVCFIVQDLIDNKNLIFWNIPEAVIRGFKQPSCILGDKFILIGEKFTDDAIEPCSLTQEIWNYHGVINHPSGPGLTPQISYDTISLPENFVKNKEPTVYGQQRRQELEEHYQQMLVEVNHG
jgi:hypothetical protein